jgi:hypothetical protein
MFSGLFSAAATQEVKTTWNGAISHTTSGEACVDWFFTSSRGVSAETTKKKMIASYTENALDTRKLCAYIRDSRGGKGERDISRWMMIEFATNLRYVQDLEIFKNNLIHYLGDFGRWDDWICLIGTPVEEYVIDLVAFQLVKDLILYESGSSFSMCAKWVPSAGKAADKKTGAWSKLCHSMARIYDRLIGTAEMHEILHKKFPVENFRHKEMRQLVSMLRKKLDVVERRLCAGDLSGYEYSHCPSRAMALYGAKDAIRGKFPITKGDDQQKHAFERQDTDGFTAFREKLASGDKTVKVNAGQLFPHEIINGLALGDELKEAQWKEHVKKARDAGGLTKAIAIVDTSGSMSGRNGSESSVAPIDVALALGLLISEVTHEAFRDLIITFSKHPAFHKLPSSNDTSLYDRVHSLNRIDWDMTTNFQAVFDLLLNKATSMKLKKEEMPEVIVTISDMQFNSAEESKTNFEAIQKKYDAAGYKMPHIVFWNVNGSTSDYPCLAADGHASLISGFSIDLLKCVCFDIDNIHALTPYKTMRQALDIDRYSKIM